MPTSPELKNARKRIEAQLEGMLDDRKIRQILEDALAVKKKGWADFACKHCGKRQRQQAEILDTVGVTKVLEVMMNQSMGKPQDQPVDAGLTVNYKVDLGD